jgi:hypothetical protein
MAVRRRLVEQTLLLTFAQLLALAVGFVATIAITRALGPEARGLYAWVLTWTAIAVQIAALASNQTVRGIAGEFAGEPGFLATIGTCLIGGAWLRGSPTAGHFLNYVEAQQAARILQNIRTVEPVRKRVLAPHRRVSCAPGLVSPDHDGERLRMVAHEPVDERKLFLRSCPRNGKLDKEQTGQRVQPLRREQLDARVFETELR